MLGRVSLFQLQAALTVVTGAAAVATVFMAWKTREMAEKTADVATHTRDEAQAVQEEARAVLLQAEVTRAALQASILPWLRARSNVEVNERGGAFFAIVRLENIGNGLALIKPIDGCRIFSNPQTGDKPEVFYARPDRAVIASTDQPSEVHFEVSSLRGGPTLERFSGQASGLPAAFDVEIEYTDARGDQATVMQLHVGHLPEVVGRPAAWFTLTASYRRSGENQPFAITDLRV